VGQHFFYFDDALKAQSLEKIWSLYPKVLALYPDNHRPTRVDIPFRGVQIPGYLRLQPTPGEPLVVQINGLDNLKEIEQHTIGQMLFQAGFNAITFDGPGQGEMRKSLKMIPDYHAAGEKELKFYPDGEHVCANYLDEVLPYATDWLKKHLTR